MPIVFPIQGHKLLNIVKEVLAFAAMAFHFGHASNARVSEGKSVAYTNGALILASIGAYFIVLFHEV